MARLVLIFGVSPRSGTNYLSDLVALHPDVEASTRFFEDGFALFADQLDGYSKDLVQFWGRFSGQNFGSEFVMGSLGEGLAKLLLEGSEAKAVVSKTPYPNGLDHVPHLFPEAVPVIVVRNGLAVVASAKKTWGSRVSTAAHRWAEGARRIEAFRKQVPNVTIVRYEDLLVDPLAEVKPVLAAADLDPALLTEDLVGSLGVRGSSELTGSGQMHWEPVAAPTNFDPRNREKELTDSERQIFFSVAGREQELLGYDIDQSRPGAITRLRGQSEVAAYRLAVALGRAPSKLGR